MSTPTLFIDTREPWPHPWVAHLPEARFVRQGLETGDICLAGNTAVVIERKTVSDFLGSITAGRDRFERELHRAKADLHQFHIVVEGSFIDCLEARGGITTASLIGSVAAITRRWCPVLFAGTQGMAAKLALAILLQPYSEANKLAASMNRASKKAANDTPVDDDGVALY
jgi:ERCC4-type nuclease